MRRPTPVLLALMALFVSSCGDDSVAADAGGDAARPITDSAVDAIAMVDTGVVAPLVPDEGPALLFSDLVSAPVGAFVTVWGRELGASGTIRLAGTPCEVLSWGVDDGNGLTRIELVVPIVGEEISVDGVEGSLPFSGRTEGNVFFVHHDDGGDSNPGTEASPFRTLGQARRSLGPGDIAYVRESTTPYAELDANGADSAFEAMILVRDSSSGTPALPIAIVGYPSELPILDAGAADARRAVHFAGASHWTIAKLTFEDGRANAINVAGGAMLSVGVRLVANRATNFVPPNSGVFNVNACRGLRVLGNHIYDAGVPGENNSHMLYFGGFHPDSEDIELAYNHIHGERGGRLIQVYGHRDDDNLRGLHIHHNILYDGPYDGVLVSRSDGANPAWIEDAHIHHNLIHDAARAGINLLNPGCAFDVHDNVVYASGRTIWVNDIRSAEVYDNCLDADVTNDAGGNVRDNRVDYPACAM